VTVIVWVVEFADNTNHEWRALGVFASAELAIARAGGRANGQACAGEVTASDDSLLFHGEDGVPYRLTPMLVQGAE
jgi:hypothetical protein